MLIIMEIRTINSSDIPAWITLSKEYDRYVQEIVPDLTEWYEGNETSLPFKKYMQAKIDKNEAFMASDDNSVCCGAIAVSKSNNNISFFAISHKYDFLSVGNILLEHALYVLNTEAIIKVNIIKNNADHIQKQHTLFSRYGFVYSHDDLENGVPVRCMSRIKPCTTGYSL